LLTNKLANDTAAEFVHDKVRSVLRDPVIAEALCPSDYPFGTRRVCVDIDYYETFNRPNVTLVDLRKTPIETIVPTGVQTSAARYQLDALVFATGFDAMTGALLNVEVR